MHLLVPLSSDPRQLGSIGGLSELAGMAGYPPRKEVLASKIYPLSQPEQ